MARLLANPRVLVLFIAVIIVSGLAALASLPRAEDPRIGNRHAAVLTAFPGASSTRVEALVTEPLENKLREIPEIVHVDSNSSAGLSAITIELDDSVGIDETDSLWAEVRDKLDESLPLLPVGAVALVLDDQRSYSYTMIIALTWQGLGDPDLLVLGRYAQELESRLRGVAGTDYLKRHGQPDEEILVSVDNAKAAALGLTVEQVAQAVLSADAKVAAGELRNNHQRLAIEVEGALDSQERIRQIPLVFSRQSGSLQVGDVASVERGMRTPISKMAIIDGQPAVVLGVRMLPDQRGDLWSERIHRALDNTRVVLPADVGIDVLFDQEVYTAERLGDLTRNVVIGFCLISLVLLLTLGWRSALIVASALPLTVLFALTCMHYSGLPIHQMSVTGLIVALGIMVDNAIVMTDTVDRNKRAGMSGMDATTAAVRHLWMPLLGSTLTTILAFMPIVLMPGPAGEFVGGISLTVIFSLIGSYLISHVAVAGLAGHFLIPPRNFLFCLDLVGLTRLAVTN
ncbi:MAG: efflux RND transporter permease subunit [Halieaceae bacterium]|nr:efflux RND transporter permease subunit [Halieaceae bacterium]